MKLPRILALLISLAALPASSGQEAKKVLHPDFPVVEGKYQLTDDWSITLDQKHNRRIEDGSMVIWRPGFTVWLKVWKLKDGETPAQRLGELKKGIDKKATDPVEEKEGKPLRFSYRLKEEADDKRQAAFYGFAVGPESHVSVSIYFDREDDLKQAKEVFKSLTAAEPKK